MVFDARSVCLLLELPSMNALATTDEENDQERIGVLATICLKLEAAIDSEAC